MPAKPRTVALQAALTSALAQYAELMGQPFPCVPELDLHGDGDFWALAELEGEGFAIRVGGGVAPTLERFWNDAFGDEDFIAGVSMPFVADKADAIHVSLVWLILHELQHFELGHFDLIGSPIISETERGKAFSLASRGSISSEQVKNFTDAPQFLIEQCLELQADHDAAELVLDAYSTDEWPSLRARIAAISAMMMLIEREDTKLVEHAQSSHPKAATRIFQLLGHVMEMPLLPAQRKAIVNGADAIDPADLPSDAEQSAFNREVVIPAFFDAVNLARIAGAESIRHDLGEAGAFFQDVQIAKLGDAAAFAGLQTVGAKQWAELVVINEQLQADHS